MEPIFTWWWCRKNHVWAKRPCKHARCGRITILSMYRPTEEPR